MSPIALRSALVLLCLSLAVLTTPGCGREPEEPPPNLVVRANSAPEHELEETPEEVEETLEPGAAPADLPAWTAQTSVGKVVADEPATARIFELLKIDYCCGGKRSLAEIAAEWELDVEALLRALAVARSRPEDKTVIRWETRTLADLIDHIEATHHVFLRGELPRLSKIFATVVRVHGQHHPELAEAQDVFGALHEELLPHLRHEEAVVFPAVRKHAAGEESGELEQALAQMRSEHDGAGAALHKLRALLKDYVPPESACTAYTELLRGLQALEENTLQHVHLENNVLLPRCLERN